MTGRHYLVGICGALLLPAELTCAEQDSSRWCFEPLVAPAVPEVEDESWPRTPIDRFILARLESEGLSPQAEADRYTLIRRTTADLTGLPPTHAELDQFLGDSRAGAFERLVDRLLASRHYGERWGRHWLDVARFGESDGILTVNEDKVRPDAWRYRDAVIRALNADLPFNHFVQYQLAGVGTSRTEAVDYSPLRQFIHLGTRLQNNADPNDKQWHRLDDMVSATGNAFLGLSFGCARCHDHPVDPMSTKEYYQFTAIFFDQFRQEPKASAKKIPIHITEPRVLLKGSWSTPGDPVSPSFLNILMRQPSEHWRRESTNELQALADWITDPTEGAGQLLARVIVNRLWHHHFGRGLVDTPNDFGALGSQPSHPELLDWLAGQLIANDWRLKSIHRLIVTSAVYRQSGAAGPAALARDAENALLWHRRPQRLEAEAIRDRLLSVAGELRLEMFGPGIPIGTYKQEVRDEPQSWRRSIYLQANRSARHPTLSLFDPPVSERSVGSRRTGASAESALFALNAPLVWDLAQRFASRVAGEAGDDPRARIRHAYLLALSRPPTSEEIEIGLDLLRQENESALVEYCHVLLGLNEFIYIH